MSESAKVPEDVRRMAEQHGLAKALKLFPEGVKAAAERGLEAMAARCAEGHLPHRLARGGVQPGAVRQMTDLAWLGVAEGAALLRSRKLSPVDWTRALLDRIAAVDGQYNAYLAVTADKAMTQAKTAETEIAKGAYRGPMHGVPYAAKDIFDVEGMATTCHSKIRKDHRATSSAFVIKKLHNAGAVLLGKVALHEFATRRAGVRPCRGRQRAIPGTVTGIRAARRAVRAPRSPQAWRPPRSAPTPAARCATRRRAAALSA